MKRIVRHMSSYTLGVITVGLFAFFSALAIVLSVSEIQLVFARVIFAQLGIDAEITYSKSRIMPGHLAFSKPNFVYRSKSTAVDFFADTLAVDYSLGRRISIPVIFARNLSLRIHSLVDDNDGKPSFLRIPTFSVSDIHLENISLDFGKHFAAESISFDGDASIRSQDGKLSISANADSLKGKILGRANIKFATVNLSIENDTLNARGFVALDSTKVFVQMHDFAFDGATFKCIDVQSEKAFLREIDTLLDLDILEGVCCADGKIFRPHKDTVALDIAVNGVVFDIPVVTPRATINYSGRKGVANIAADTALVWNTPAQQVRLSFFTHEKPIAYLFEIGHAQNFDLNVLDILPSDITGSARIQGSDFGDSMTMDIVANVGHGMFNNLTFDGGSIRLNAKRSGVSISPASMRFFTDRFDTSFVFIANDTLRIWGNATSQGVIDLHITGLLDEADTVLRSLGFRDMKVSGIYLLDMDVRGSAEKIIAHGDVFAKNMDFFGLTFKRAISEGFEFSPTDYSGKFKVRGFEGAYGENTIDSAYAELDLAPKKLYLRPVKAFLTKFGLLKFSGMAGLNDTLTFFLEGANLTGDYGEFELMTPFTAIVLDTISTTAFKISAYDGSIALDSFKITDSSFITSGRFDSIDVHTMAKAFADSSIYGNAKGHFAFDVNSQTYFGKGEFDVFLNEIAYNKLEFESFSASANLRADTISISRANLRKKGEAASLHGWVAFGDSQPLFDLHIDADGKTPSFLAYFSENVEPIQGRYRLELSARGKLDSLDLSGFAHVDSGKMAVWPLDHPIENIKLDAEIIGSRIEVKELSASTKTMPPSSKGLLARIWRKVFGGTDITGFAKAQGSLDVSSFRSPVMEIHGSLSNFPAQSSLMGFYMLLDGNFDFLSPEMRLLADLNILDGRIEKLGSASPEPMVLPVPINIAASTDNLWLVTKDMEARISGDILVSTVDSRPSMLANLDLTEGKYYFYGQTFDITNGSVMFNQIGALNPELDITAKTQLGNLGITLDITGNMETPHLEFYSDNATFTQDDLTQLVLGISNEGSVQGFVGQFVSHNLERIAQQTLGLDVVELQTDAMRFTVGKRIAGGLSLKYSQSIGEADTLGALYQLEYRFSRNFTIGAMQSPEGSYLMNANFRWEY